MIRNLKALGLALVAVFAMSAMTASAASANNDVFTVGDGQATALLTGISHDHKFSIGGVSFECTTAKFAGTITNNGTSATMDIEFSGTKNVVPHTTHCTSSIGTITWKTNGCHFKWTGSTTGGDPTANTDATIWIECPVGKEIETVSSTGATISIPTQTPTTGGVTYTNLPNNPGGAAIKVTATATGITYTCAPAFTCALGGLSSEGNNGATTGTVTLAGYKDENANTTTLTPAKEGTQVPVSVTTKP